MRTINAFLSISLLLLFLSCGQSQSKSQTEIEEPVELSNIDIDVKTNVEAAIDSTIQNSKGEKSANDIRFGNWTETDWYENDYFRFLRKYFDAYCNGEIDASNLPEKSLLKGKFIIFNSSPYIGGGMFIQLIFINDPDKIFTTNVYSSVDMESETVSKDFFIKGFRLNKEPSGITKKDIFDFLKEAPENKSW